MRDNILCITKPDIRRLARRGGVKRISSSIYAETRLQLLQFLRKLMFDVCAVAEMCRRKTICTTDVVWALHRQGRTIYVSESSLLYKVLSTDTFAGLWNWPGPRSK